MSDRWSERLSEHLDGELSAPEERELAAHLDGCAACTRELEGLRRVRASLGRLPGAPPPERVWLAIRDGLAPARHPAPARWRWATAYAAAAAALLVTAAAIWLSWNAGSFVKVPESEELRSAYGEAAAEWREALLEGSDGDSYPAVIRVIRSNLDPYERAIRETREALERDPGDPLLEEHLARLLQAQLRFLRRAGATVEEFQRMAEAG